MTYSNKQTIASIAAVAVMLSFAFVSAASALTVSCVGTPAATSITWAASSSGGIAPVAFLWGNGSTSTSQTVFVSPGTYSMTLQGTDASSTVATTTCSSTVALPAPTITSFTASPASITNGQSSVLAWVVANASSTSIDNGVGTVTGSSVSVSPSVTTTYHLSAVSPSGTTSASATVTVNATTSSTLAQQIQNLLNQIAALKAQILQLLQQQQGSGGSTGTTTPPVLGGVCPPDFHRDLGNGDRGDDVKQLQQTLASDPSIFPPGLITGFFGHRTEEALKKFQKKFGIFGAGSSTTGFFGPLTRDRLLHECKDDTDHDGIPNLQDTDNDNDGIPNVSDPTPFVPDTLSTATSSSSSNEGHGRGGNGGDGRGHGGDGGDGSNDD